MPQFTNARVYMSRSPPDSRKTKGRRPPASGKVREVGKAAVKAGSDRVQRKVATEVQWITVDEDMAGQRVDNFLLARLRGGCPKALSTALSERVRCG